MDIVLMLVFKKVSNLPLNRDLRKKKSKSLELKGAVFIILSQCRIKA